jgi:hypothetical protein
VPVSGRAIMDSDGANECGIGVSEALPEIWPEMCRRLGVKCNEYRKYRKTGERQTQTGRWSNHVCAGKGE